MSGFFNLDQFDDFENYGDHLFALGRRFVHFCPEGSADQLENRLETRISSSEKTGSDPRPEEEGAARVFSDGQLQTNFMKEHEFILRKYIRNNKSLFLKQGEPQNSLEEHPQSPSLAETLAVFSEQIQTSAGAKISLAFSGMMQHDKVVKFLNFILGNFDEKVSCSLLKMAVLVWIEYSRLNAKSLRELEIIEFCSRLLSSAFLRRLRSFLPISQQHVDLSQFKRFANVFVTTLLFVAFEYFVNPYYQLQVELLVREYQSFELFLYDTAVYSEEEEEEECEQLVGRKLMKLTSFTHFD